MDVFQDKSPGDAQGAVSPRAESPLTVDLGHGLRFARSAPAWSDDTEFPSKDSVDAMRAHPHFQMALRAAIRDHIAQYHCDGILDRVLNDRGRRIGGVLVMYLHYSSVANDGSPGLTIATFQAACRNLDLCSPGRARALLMLLKYGRYVASAPSVVDRRQHRLVPTQRLIEEHRQSWKSHFEAIVLITPAGSPGLDLLDRPDFFAAFVRRLGAAYLAGFRMLRYAGDLTRLVESNGGLLVMMFLFLAATDSPKTSNEAVVMISLSALCAQLGVSRAHLRNLLTCAAAEGLLIRPDGSATVVVLPRLLHAVSGLFAALFALFARCANAAAADIAA